MARSSKRPPYWDAPQRRQTGPPGTPIPRRKKPSPSGHTFDPGQRRAATKIDQLTKAVKSWGTPKPPFLNKRGRYNPPLLDRFDIPARKKR